MTSPISDISAAAQVLRTSGLSGVSAAQPVRPATASTTPVAPVASVAPVAPVPAPVSSATAASRSERANGAAPDPLEQAVQALNERYASQRTDLRFSIDKGTGDTVVSIIDSKDGTVLRQIPSEEALRISQALQREIERGTLIEQVA